MHNKTYINCRKRTGSFFFSFKLSYTCPGICTFITVKNKLRGMEVSAEKAQMKMMVVVTILGFREGTVCIRRISWTLSTLIHAKVVMVTQPLIQKTYSKVWQIVYPRVQDTVQRTATISGIVLTNSRSATNKLRVRMVLLASGLRSQVTKAAAPAFAATEMRKTVEIAKVSTIVVTTWSECCRSEKKEKYEKFLKWTKWVWGSKSI